MSTWQKFAELNEVGKESQLIKVVTFIQFANELVACLMNLNYDVIKQVTVVNLT
jgi:hypothetical protein